MKILATSHGIAREDGVPSADAFAVKSWGETVVAVLADGAGTGEPAREAAHRAVKSLIENYQARPRAWSPGQALNEFVRLLNHSFYQESIARYQRPEMVTTLAAAVIEGDHLYGVNIGDSRVCLARGGKVSVLSEDHVELQRRNVLTRALGMEETIEPNAFETTLNDGDLALLCSDGVSNHMPEEFLRKELARRPTARSLVKTARAEASSETLDDMSAIVLDIAQTGRLKAMSERDLTIPSVLRKGDLMDGYELVRCFQNSERVWLAEKDGQRAVLKFAPREAADSAPHLDAFIREAWNATRIESPCFVRACEPAGQSARYYVMEFVDAPSLATVLQSRKLSVDSAVALGKFLCDAAQNLLQHNLAHGDIKPENILCVGDYEKLSFKLVDLGSAAEIFSVTSRAGTASYLAPERFRNSPISERTEVFAIGVTLYQALTGVLPHGSIERFQTPVFHAARRPSRMNPNIPAWLDAVIMKCVALDAERRFQHFSEVSFALANPEKVEPFYDKDLPFLQRDPLRFYKTGFFVLLALSLWLLIKLFLRP